MWLMQNSTIVILIPALRLCDNAVKRNGRYSFCPAMAMECFDEFFMIALVLSLVAILE